ncbi:MAG: acyl-CoA dehydratase activase-related protein [Dehalobacterium sp.]
MIVKTVGIPKGLLYYYYHIHWKRFFQTLGFEVKVSSDTNKEIVNAGIMSAVDEACLPVKVYYGHVLDLASQVDYLFLPRVVSVVEKEYMCPKLLGLPDMLKAYLVNPPCLIDTTINLRNKNAQIDQAIKEICNIIQVPEKEGKKAWSIAERAQEDYEHYLQSGNLPPGFNSFKDGYPIALLGHGYNIYDQYINLEMINKLHGLGASVRTKEMVPKEMVDKFANQLPKRMFWTFGKQLIGSGLYYLNDPQIRGIIFVASFGCGPDSMVGELLERWARRGGKKPFMFLTIDEHSGEAGLVTRLEAFMDMIKRRAS